MFTVDIKWSRKEDLDSFSYESFSLALRETERFLSEILIKPLSIDIFEESTKNSSFRKHIASLRVLR